MNLHLMRVLCLTIGCAGLCLGSVTFTTLPRTLQLYPRNQGSDSGTVTISGRSQSCSSILVKVWRNNEALDSMEQTPDTQGLFSMTRAIFAGLVLYRFEVFCVSGTTRTLVAHADSVVCGDVFIIQGQSNAEAPRHSGSANELQSPFIRVFGSANPDVFDTTWHIAQGDGNAWSKGNTGQWGLRLARHIVEQQGIPVAIFNGARGGRPILHFLKNDADPMNLSTNYGRLLTRLHMTGLAPYVRAVAWNQGESDMSAGDIETRISTYTDRFRALYGAWLSDCPAIERVYVFQSNPSPGCAHMDHAGIIKEAQRRLAHEFSKVILMSTSGADHHDLCHYAFENGYERFGNDLYRLTARDLYNSSDTTGIDPPAIVSAMVTGEKEITLTMRNKTDVLTWKEGSQRSFRLNGCSATVIAGAAIENTVVLTLSARPTGITSISYLGDAFPDSLDRAYYADPLVSTIHGVGALHFFQFPIGSSALAKQTTPTIPRSLKNSIVPLVTAASRPGHPQTHLLTMLGRSAGSRLRPAGMYVKLHRRNREESEP